MELCTPILAYVYFDICVKYDIFDTYVIVKVHMEPLTPILAYVLFDIYIKYYIFVTYVIDDILKKKSVNMGVKSSLRASTIQPQAQKLSNLSNIRWFNFLFNF